MVNLPYFKQDTDYSCGPAVMQMVFRFYGKVFSEDKLIKKLKTNKDLGTAHQAMIELALAEGFYVYVNNESSLEEIKFFHNKNIPVIVHYLEPESEDGHYAVAIDTEEDKVILNDPWNGEKFKISYKDFEKRWRNEKGNNKKWIMVISTEDQNLGKQYLPRV